NFGGANLRESLWMTAKAKNAGFGGARLEWADFSHADVREADFSNADLSRANFHNTRDAGALFVGANLFGLRKTDVDRLEAESYRPPPREKRV
ncbi:MAG TPA: pentapeptide repeat-containing protein, partial [Polyangium sp.]|nr:pentapeptide repeat-containing protein [Polyangium sp.]